MNQLIIKNVTFSYGKKMILDDIAMNIDNGLIGLLGKNGAGKTTLLKIIATLNSSKTGYLKLNNMLYEKEDFNIRKYIGYLQQDFNMYKNIKGIDYLDFVAKSRNIEDIDSEINKVVNDLNLNEHINKKIKTYSGGIRRRLGIAQAILGDTKLIILDEPTVGLDPYERNEFRKIIKMISKDRIVLMSTHITEDVEFLCDKLLILHNKKIAFEGSVNNFIESNSKNICVEYVNEELFNVILKEKKIISYQQENESICVKYIDDESKSIHKNISLQDAYMNFLGE